MASPYARKLAAEAGVDIADATPTGTNDRVVAADVQELISEGGGATPLPPTFRSPLSKGCCLSLIGRIRPCRGMAPSSCWIAGVHRAASDDSATACGGPEAASSGLASQLAAGMSRTSDPADDWT